MENEVVIMQLIANGGDAKSHAMKSIALAQKGQFAEADEALATAATCVSQAHHGQTALIQGEARGEKHEVSLLMVHAQDHLMNAITILDLAKEFVKLYKKMEGLT
ncbi:PTS system, cellobiose-specific IIA component [Amphibacillus marinus]|uniref:PTS system, cellobiose-specific IIA component n=1 Tax=Amphibacillus marinus TaxID=872970 RepID=A0A1H8KK82_9BACI|nr:PTS lactose/cellobiose transporter subunit IIA [Amphibacillus marinus]SEN93400.1 PTS system, cellobiose-specific IIA component [Amphibacillus marinus]